MEKIADEVIEILEYLNTDKMKRLKKENIDIYKQHVMNKYENFEYFSILKVLLSEDKMEINKLTDMMRMVDDINKGKRTYMDANEEVKEKRAEEYIYPKFGGKEKMEEKLKKRAREK